VKYQAVILNFDDRTAKYVGAQQAAKTGSKSQRVAAPRTGTAPPPQKPKR